MGNGYNCSAPATLFLLRVVVTQKHFHQSTDGSFQRAIHLISPVAVVLFGLSLDMVCCLLKLAFYKTVTICIVHASRGKRDDRSLDVIDGVFPCVVKGCK